MANLNGNTNNLIRMEDRTEEERRAIASKGGKKKAERERNRKAVAETFNTILALEYDQPTEYRIERHGIDRWDIEDSDFWVNLQGQTLLTRMCCGIVREAMKGDLKACKLILDYIEPITKGEVLMQEESQI